MIKSNMIEFETIEFEMIEFNMIELEMIVEQKLWCTYLSILFDIFSLIFFYTSSYTDGVNTFFVLNL